MIKPLLYNNQPTIITTSDLPCLIHGAEGSGASMFSISLVANLYSQGEKLLFLCGYHMARDEFLEQTGALPASFLVKTVQDLQNVASKSIIFVPREAPHLFSQLIQELPDIQERVVFVKNIELFKSSLFDLVRPIPKIIVSGNIDDCSFGAKLFEQQWATRIDFSKPQSSLDPNFPELPKYSGYFKSFNKSGIVSLG